MSVLVFHSIRYHIDIGAHVFPTVKYRRVVERLQRERPDRLSFVEPEPASWEDLALVHTPEYLQQAADRGASRSTSSRSSSCPWSPEVVDGFRLMTGGTDSGRAPRGWPAASRSVVSRRRRTAPRVRESRRGLLPVQRRGGRDPRAASATAWRRAPRSIDLDVHHGNGTAFIFERDPRVFTFSMHQQHNYPMHKPRGSLDIGLRRRHAATTSISTRLTAALPQVFEHQPDIVFYLAGADPYRGRSARRPGADARRDCAQRDREVLHACSRARRAGRSSRWRAAMRAGSRTRWTFTCATIEEASQSEGAAS